MSFNIFGNPTKDDIRVAYISTERGMVNNVTVCEANDYAKLNPEHNLYSEQKISQDT